MTSLRLIILVIGLIFIAVVYFWESIKQKRVQRKQTVRRTVPEHDLSDVKIIREPETGNDEPADLPELVQALADTSDIDDRSRGRT